VNTGENIMNEVLRIMRPVWIMFAVAGIAIMLAAPALAHCDGMDGPVVQAAQAALAKGDVNLVLIWVGKADEPAIREAFDRTMVVRKLGPQAAELADMYFFETLVRIHRTSEGAPYTGLKPAGRDLGPAIPAADKALRSGDMTALIDLLVGQLRAGITDRFKTAMAAKNYKSEDVDAGREYVETYVSFIHYVETTYETAAHPAKGHFPEVAADGYRQQDLFRASLARTATCPTESIDSGSFCLWCVLSACPFST
jgi:hypothetical protein